MVDGFNIHDLTRVHPATLALDRVSLDVAPGEIHVVLGASGAGKSTLHRVVGGFERADAGGCVLGGRRVRPGSLKGAARAGIGVVRGVAPAVDRAMGAEAALARAAGAWVRRRERPACLERARRRLRGCAGLFEAVAESRWEDLEADAARLLEVLGAVGRATRLLVLDEPARDLGRQATAWLSEMLFALRRDGVGVLHLCSDPSEALFLGDRITVLRDGRRIGTLARGGANETALLREMYGEEPDRFFPDHLETRLGRVMLSAEAVSAPGACEAVSFKVRAGEVVGLAGRAGSGARELLTVLAGLDPAARGRVHLDGRRLEGGAPFELRRAAGLAYLPPLHAPGARFPGLSGAANLLPGTAGARSPALARARKLGLGEAAMDGPIETLAPAAQQKIRFDRVLAAGAKLLLVDEPTGGLPVAGKQAILRLMDRVAGEGVAVLFYSADLFELTRHASRVLVMRGGQLTGSSPRGALTPEDLRAMQVEA